MENQVLASLEKNPVTDGIVEGSDGIGNLQPMEEALLLAAAFARDHKPRIIVKKNRYEAQQLYQRLKPLQDQVLLFVMEESLRVSSIAASPQDLEEQLETLNAMRSDTPKIIITNTAAFLRFLPDRKLFDSLCFELKTGQEIKMEDLKEKLQEAGYGKVHYVDRPCTYASRGGIIDIYSLNYENPLRIEFFDSEIDSIRFFDPSTQRTIKSISQAEIIPATDMLFSQEQIEQIKEQIAAFQKEELPKLSLEDQEILTDALEADIRALESHDPAPHLYRYFSLLKPANLLDYASGQVILSSEEEIEAFAKQLVLDNTAFIQELVSDHKAMPRYTMFHDLLKMEADTHPLCFHEFMPWNTSLNSQIYPAEPQPGSWQAWVPQVAEKPNVLFAMEKEDIDLMKDKMDISKLQFTDSIFYEGFSTPDYTVYTRKEIFRHLNRRTPYQKTFKEGQVLQNVLELQPGDYVVHEQYGIGQYLGIVTREQKGIKADYLHIAYRDGDDLYVPLNKYQLVRKYVSKEGVGTRLSKLGSGQWEKTKAKVSQKVEEIAGRLVDLYAARNENIGYAFPEDGPFEREFDEAFEYEPTPDQLQAEAEIKENMEKAKPMDHLLCGDVGFGKTEVAMRAAFKAVAAGKQVAFLCPTTILSMQHYKTLQKRFESYGVEIALVNRFASIKEVHEIQKKLKKGQIDIVVGTHRLLNKGFEYKDLGLLIIDEEQRFGVEHKEKIKEMKNSIDVLSLSATPIPRTLQMSLIGVRTISTLNTPPAHRLPIQTYVMEKKGKVVEEIIQRELARDGQVFYLHNKVQDIYKVAKDLQQKFPDVEIGVAHGKMNREEIENVMVDFAAGKYDILVCTTIIETGLDIANANTIIIEDADHFGLAQLYQIRGRVGRRDKLAYCYLMIKPERQLTEQAQKRLKSIKEFTQLGSGYKIAMRDLTIRGAGDMLGPQQAGFIDQVGLDLYLEMLSEAIARKQGKTIQPKEEQKTASIQVEGYIPAPFTSNDGDKLSLYQEIKNVNSSQELSEYEQQVQDLFGRIPKEVQQLFEQKKLDLFVNEPGVDSLTEKQNVITIQMTPVWSASVDGARLFQAVSQVSRNVKLSYKNKQIVLQFDKRKNYLDVLNKLIQILLDPAYQKTPVSRARTIQAGG